MLKSKKAVERRNFLKGAALGGVATLAANAGALAAQPFLAPAAPPADAASEPFRHRRADHDRPGSDFMVDVIKSLGFEYIAANPGSSFRALHESFINYGGNKAPEFITCCHEESSVAHGARLCGSGRKADAGDGAQHGGIAACVDGDLQRLGAAARPFTRSLATPLMRRERRPGVEWYHSAQDAAAMVRDYTKWDDLPISLPHFAESAVRAYKIAMTPPMGRWCWWPIATCRKTPLPKDAALRIPKLILDAPPQGDSGSVAEAARLLVAAENPVMFAGRVGAHRRRHAAAHRTRGNAAGAGRRSGRQFALASSAQPVAGGRGLIANADVIVGLEVARLLGRASTRTATNCTAARSPSREARREADQHQHSRTSYIKSNYQDFQRYHGSRYLAMAADPEATLPSLDRGR